VCGFCPRCHLHCRKSNAGKFEFYAFQRGRLNFTVPKKKPKHANCSMNDADSLNETTNERDDDEEDDDELLSPRMGAMMLAGMRVASITSSFFSRSRIIRAHCAQSAHLCRASAPSNLKYEFAFVYVFVVIVWSIDSDIDARFVTAQFRADVAWLGIEGFECAFDTCAQLISKLFRCTRISRATTRRYVRSLLAQVGQSSLSSSLSPFGRLVLYAVLYMIVVCLISPHSSLEQQNNGRTQTCSQMLQRRAAVSSSSSFLFS
jgi:hypothetical protein